MKLTLATLLLLPTLAGAQLNISISTFDPGVPADYSQHQDLRVFPKIREIESLFLPFALRQALTESGRWGAVRVVPEADDAAELLITGLISHSDGETLAIELRAVDARGVEWLSGTYSTNEHYDALFDDFVADLEQVLDGYDDRTLRGIVHLSLMRYAANLVPEAYAEYFEALPDGTYQLLRLPAETDPIMARIERVRSVEFVMTDAIDEKFRELHDEVDDVYKTWRDYRRRYATFRSEEARRNEHTSSNAASGSYAALRKAYDNYRLDRLATQEQEKWIVGFNNEMTPMIARIDERIAEMNGWVEDGYSDWTRILGELFEIEGGFQ
jgi:hypothetical protein